MERMRSSTWRRHAAALVAGTFLTSGIIPPALADIDFPTTTPIKHVVIIFQENASFDHYFATYPVAKNAAIATINPVTGLPHGGTPFTPREDTPTVNGQTDGNTVFPERVATGVHNFNINFPAGTPTTGPAADANGGANPFLLLHDQAVTCSNNHDYNGEQLAADGGLMDKFPQNNTETAGSGCAPDGTTVMGYYDGTTVTALWNYAQRFAMSDNSWGTTFGPSTPGALNLVSGQLAGAVLHTFSGATKGLPQPVDTIATKSNPDVFFVGPTNPAVPATLHGNLTANTINTVPDQQTGTLTTDNDPYLDDCGADHGGTVPGQMTMEMTGRNVGDLLNVKNITWGWFGGGFRTAAKANPVTTDPTHPLAGVSTTTPDDPFGQPTFGGLANDGQAQNAGKANFVPATCNAAHVLHPDSTVSFDNTPALVHPTRTDFNPHHSSFQYYASTRNPHHLPPKSVAEIGHNGQANHQYDLLDFFTALRAGNLPAVSFLKGQNMQDGHPGGESDPLSEQRFLAQVINALQASPEWAETAVFIAWDDSDGWYDHTLGTIVNPSAATGFDALNPANGGNCGTPKADALQGRCGLGPRLPLNVISAWAKVNYVDHSLSDQSSLLRFIEDNWNLDYIDGETVKDPVSHLRTPGFAVVPQAQSFDVITGSLDNEFDFDDAPNLGRLIINPTTGAVIK
jgi:phospholipase C